MKTNKNTRTPKTKKALPQTFKVQYADREFNFLGEEIFEATDSQTAWDLAKQIAERRYGNLLELYSLVRYEDLSLWRAV